MRNYFKVLPKREQLPFWHPLEGWLVLEGGPAGPSYAAAHYWSAATGKWSCGGAGPLHSRHPRSPNIRPWKVWPDEGRVPLCEACKNKNAGR